MNINTYRTVKTMTTLFTDVDAALEEAEYLANECAVTHSIVVFKDRNQLHVMPKKEAMMAKLMDSSATILENINPVNNFSIWN